MPPELPELDVTCPKCKGVGVLRGKDAEAFHQEWERKHGATWRLIEAWDLYESVTAAGAAAGCVDAPKPTEPRPKKHPPAPPDPQECTCPTCGGLKRVPTEAGRKLLGFLSLHRGR